MTKSVLSPDDNVTLVDLVHAMTVASSPHSDKPGGNTSGIESKSLSPSVVVSSHSRNEGGTLTSDLSVGDTDVILEPSVASNRGR